MKYKAIRKIKWGFYKIMNTISIKSWGNIATTMLNGLNTRVSKDTWRLQKLGRAYSKASGLSFCFLQEHNSYGVGGLSSQTS